MTYNKKDYNKHLQTQKHSNIMSLQKEASTNKYQCELCNRTYKNKCSFGVHRKKCTLENTNTNSDEHDETDDTNITTMISQDNTDLQFENRQLKQMLYEMISNQNKLVEKQNTMENILLDIYSKEPTNTIINNQTNTQNNTFNLMFFLNEICKDAMNLNDFVDSLEVTFKEVEDMGRLGYMQGISNIIMNGLSKLDITKRPIHCTDLKRQTIYVKDNNKWHKDDACEKIKKAAIYGATKKNIMQFKEWVSADPRRSMPDTKEYNTHVQIMSQCLNIRDIDHKNEDRIISNIAKLVYLDKETKDKMTFV